MKTREAVRDARGLLEAFAPEIVEAMLSSRDVAMFSSLTSGAALSALQAGNDVCAVVGLAHVDGMENLWENVHGTGTAAPIDTSGMVPYT